MSEHSEMVSKVKEIFEYWGFIMQTEQLVPKHGFDTKKVIREKALEGSSDYLKRIDLLGLFVWDEKLDNLDVDKEIDEGRQGTHVIKALIQQTIRDEEYGTSKRFSEEGSFTIGIEVCRTTDPREEAEKLSSIPLDFWLIITENFEGFIDIEKYDKIYCAKISNLDNPVVIFWNILGKKRKF